MSILHRNLSRSICRQPLDTDVCGQATLFLTHFVVPVDENAGVGRIVGYGEVVSFVGATTAQTPLVGHSGVGVLVKDALVEIVFHDDQVVEEGEGDDSWGVGVRETVLVVVDAAALDQRKVLSIQWLALFLKDRRKGMIGYLTYAIGRRECLCVGAAIDLDVEGQINLAVTVVFLRTKWVAKVTAGGAG